MDQDYDFESDQEIDGDTEQDTTGSATAIRSIELAVVRSGTPSQIGCLLCDMERTGEIYSDILSDADDDLLEDSDLEDGQTDCDIDLDDEDDFKTHDDAMGDSEIPVLGSGRWATEYSAFDPSEKFELRFCESGGKVSCRIHKDPRSRYYGNSSRANNMLYELASRYEVLERIGEWLAVNRRTFLRTGDLWDFVEKAWEEVEAVREETGDSEVERIQLQAAETLSSLFQKSFIRVAELGCSRASLSRFIEHAVLLFEGKRPTPVSWLFSKEAKCAWVARAFYGKCRSIGLKDMEVAATILQSAKADRKNDLKQPLISLGSMSLKEIASLLCGLAGVGGAKVIELFGDKIKEANNGKQ